MPQPSPNSERTILIASSGQDRPAWAPVAQILSSQGYNIVSYQGDAVASGRHPFDAIIDNANGLRFKYNGRDLPLEQVDAALYGRPNNFVPSPADPNDHLKLEERPTLSIPAPNDAIQQLRMDAERSADQEVLWDHVRDDAWISPPRNMREIQRPMKQLWVAREVGMTILTTVITNNWSTVNDLFPDDVVFKAPDSVVRDGYDAHTLHPTRIVSKDRKSLETGANPFPGHWQDLVKKIEREWRIAVIGSRSFDVAVYPPGSKRKKASELPTVQFAVEPFPDEHKEKCLSFLAKAGLRMGEFQFVESDEGITFLGFASNGPLGWYEKDLHLPIHQTIADTLADIAHRQ